MKYRTSITIQPEGASTSFKSITINGRLDVSPEHHKAIMDYLHLAQNDDSNKWGDFVAQQLASAIVCRLARLAGTFEADDIAVE